MRYIAIVGFLCLSAVCSGASRAKTMASPIVALQQGFRAAQACEAELDDDVAHYLECVRHVEEKYQRAPGVLLGLTFQAWLQLDLAARQHSTGAEKGRTAFAAKLWQRLRDQKLKPADLCAAKTMSCTDVELRLRHVIH